MAENLNGTNKPEVEKTEELQHVCKFENDENELFFDSYEYPYSQRTEVDDGKISVHENRNISEETESAFVLSDSTCSDRESQSIDLKSQNEAKLPFSVNESSDECDQTLKVKTKHQNVETINQSTIETGKQIDEQDALNTSKGVEKSGTLQESAQSKNGTMLERSDSCTDFCKMHPDEILKYICNSCKKVGCQVCITLEHKNCNSCEFIPAFIKRADFKEEIEKFEGEINDIKKRLTQNNNKIKFNVTKSENMRAQAKADLNNHRDEINKMFSVLEKDLERKISQIEKDDTKKMQLLNLEEENLEQEFRKLEQDFFQRKHASNKTAVFTKVKMSKDEIGQIKNKLEKLETSNTVQSYIYKPSKRITDVIEDISTLGNILDSNMERQFTSIKPINMKADTDVKQCKISGLEFVSDQHVIAVDYNNSSVKVVDICEENLLTALPMQPAAFDVTVVCDQPRQSKLDESNVEIALTIPEGNKINFMQFSLSRLAFSVIRDIQTNGQCRGVFYHKKSLFITFPTKGKIEIVDMQGNLFKRITTETVGRLFQPHFVTMNTVDGTIVVSDGDNHSVTSMTLDGEIMDSYTDHDLVSPRGLCVARSGAVFVCAFGSQTFHHLSGSCKGVSVIRVATETQPLPSPFSITYNDELDILVVGHFTGDCIKAYKLE